MKYGSWGRYPNLQADRVHSVAWQDQIGNALAATTKTALPYGLGRSYGDACLNGGGELIDCTRLDHILAADWEQGVVRVEAGMSLASLLEIIMPRGWFLPVTPGTKYVTIGGAIANDVHGKNHHRAGTFGRFVSQMLLHRSNGSRFVCSTGDHPELFAATIGGLGLTGVIVWADLQLKPILGSWIDSETLPFESLEEFETISASSDAGFEYTVAWIDCLGDSGRGIFFRGNHSAHQDPAVSKAQRFAFPFTAPEWLLSKPTIQLFNSAYFRRHRLSSGSHRVHYNSFFYPLDSIRDWNLMYGKRGFLQYQLVVPNDQLAALRTILATISAAGNASFLAVLKKFGGLPSPGIMSFPRAGYTLALDLPFRGERTLKLLDTLDAIVMEARGAIYPAKDARMSPAMFSASFPQLEEFKRYVDPKLSSSFWRRVTA